MRFACIEGDDHALVIEINFYILHAVDFHQDRAQLAHTFVAIFAFRRDFDRFQNGVIRPFGIERIGWVRISWSCGVHRFLYLTCDGGAVVVFGMLSS